MCWKFETGRKEGRGLTHFTLCILLWFSLLSFKRRLSGSKHLGSLYECLQHRLHFKTPLKFILWYCLQNAAIAQQCGNLTKVFNHDIILKVSLSFLGFLCSVTVKRKKIYHILWFGRLSILIKVKTLYIDKSVSSWFVPCSEVAFNTSKIKNN